MSTIELTKELGRLEKGLLEFALKLTRDRTDAFDLYQETAYRALKNFHQFKPNTNLRAWLMTIMRNIFINAYRKKRRRQVCLDWSGNNYLIDSTSESVVNHGVLKVNYEELIAVVDRLDEYLKIPFLLTYQGYKYQEVAEELCIPLGTVKSRVFMARQQIRNFIKHHYAVQRKEELSAA